MTGGIAAAARVVAEARALVGVRFRLHGRTPEQGLDCVGLTALALARAGHVGSLPLDYGLRTRDVGRAIGWLDAAGLVAADGQPGDVALVRAGPVQLHLAVMVPGGFVHAHASLRRVVETPGPLPWPVIGHWCA